MKVGDADIVSRHCGNCVYLRSTCTAEAGFCTVYSRDTMIEDSCEHFANVAIKGRFSEIERLPNKETKGIHPEPIEDSLMRDLKKENIKLRSLCRKAAEQVIDDHKETLQKLADNPYPYKHLKEECVAYQEGGMGCPDCYCDSSCKDDSCHICGGKTKGREMKTTSIKTVYLKECELKQAIVEYLAKEHEDLAQHLYDNECDMVWGQDGEEFLVSIDGEVEDKEVFPENAIFPAAGNTSKTENTGYTHLRSHCVAWLQGGIGCPDCYDFICDVCGKKHNSMERHTLKTEQLSGVVMCEDCKWHKDWHACDCGILDNTGTVEESYNGNSRSTGGRPKEEEDE